MNRRIYKVAALVLSIIMIFSYFAFAAEDVTETYSIETNKELISKNDVKQLDKEYQEITINGKKYKAKEIKVLEYKPFQY